MMFVIVILLVVRIVVLCEILMILNLALYCRLLAMRC